MARNAGRGGFKRGKAKKPVATPKPTAVVTAGEFTVKECPVIPLEEDFDELEDLHNAVVVIVGSDGEAIEAFKHRVLKEGDVLEYDVETAKAVTIYNFKEPTNQKVMFVKIDSVKGCPNENAFWDAVKALYRSVYEKVEDGETLRVGLMGVKAFESPSHSVKDFIDVVKTDFELYKRENKDSVKFSVCLCTGTDKDDDEDMREAKGCEQALKQGAFPNEPAVDGSSSEERGQCNSTGEDDSSKNEREQNLHGLLSATNAHGAAQEIGSFADKSASREADSKKRWSGDMTGHATGCGAKRFKTSNNYKSAWSMLDRMPNTDKVKVTTVENRVSEFIAYHLNVAHGLKPDLNSQRALEIDEEAVSSFFYLLINPLGQVSQAVASEPVTLVHDEKTDSVDPVTLISGQHRGAILLLVHLGISPVLTAEGPRYIKYAEMKDEDGDSFSYDTKNPNLQWGYRNFELWKEHLENSDKAHAEKTLEKFSHCFSWIEVLKQLACFNPHAELDEKRTLLAWKQVEEFYNATFRYMSIHNMKREDVYKLYVASYASQRHQTFDTTAVMGCSSMIQLFRAEMPMYEARQNSILRNLYVRNNMSDSDPTSSFYVDLTLAYMLHKGQSDNLIMMSDKRWNSDTVLSPVLEFLETIQTDEQKKDVAEKAQQVKRFLDFAESKNDAVQNRIPLLKEVMKQGGPALRDTLVLFWYLLMECDDVFCEQNANDLWQQWLIPNTKVHQPNIKASVFYKIVERVRKSKSFKDAAEEVKCKFFIREIRQSDDEAMEED